MSRWLTITLTLLMLSVAIPAAADDWDDCIQGRNPDLGTRGCTNVIQSGRESPENLAMAYSNRGIYKDNKGDIDRAIADFDTAIQLNPDFAIAYFNRGNAHDDKGDTDRAIADYDKAIELDPNDPDAYSNRGHTYFEIGDNDRAIADYDRAIELDPDHLHAIQNRSFAYSNMGDFEAAVLDLRRAVQNGSDYGKLWLFIAQSRAGQDGATELTANAASLRPKGWPYPVVELYLGRQSPDTIFAKAGNTNERCEAYYYVGEWHLMQGRQDEAISAFRAAVETCPKNYFEHSRAVAELGRIE